MSCFGTDSWNSQNYTLLSEYDTDAESDNDQSDDEQEEEPHSSTCNRQNKGVYMYFMR